MSEPVFVHDCDVCRFLGHEDGHDFYACPGSDPTVIARYGSEGRQYASAPVDVVRATMGEPAGSTRELLRRAVELMGVAP